MDNRGEDRGDAGRPTRDSAQRPEERRERRPEGGSRDGEHRYGDRKIFDRDSRPTNHPAGAPRYDRSDHPGGDRPARPGGDRPDRGDRGPRPGGDRPYRPTGDRPDRGPRPGGDRPDRGPRPGGDRSYRPGGDRSDRGPRPGGDRPGGDRPFRSRDSGREGPPRNRELAAIQDVDEELLRLIMRRAHLLSKLRVGERLDPALEKALRTSWEEKAAHFSRDSRMARELFALLQSVEPLTRQEEEQAFFNLAPRREPVNIALPAPANSIAARCWLALAAATGQKIELRDLSLTDGVIESVKALNQVGGQLWWEDTGTILNRGGTGLTRGMDKVVHVGGDAFNLWLVLALCLGVPTRLKLMGGSSLRFLDLAPLRHFLPDLGTRLTNVIPNQNGLPVRVECSGMLPNEVRLPDNLPPAFIAALLLAAPFWEQATRLFLPAGAAPLADLVISILKEAGAHVKREGVSVMVTPGPLTLPGRPNLPMDVPLAATLLAFPAYVGGSVRLEGMWPKLRHDDTGTLAAQAEILLRAAGVTLTVEDGGVTATRKAQDGEGEPAVSLDFALDQTATRQLLQAAPDLLPLTTALTASSALQGAPAFLPLEGPQDGGSDDENVLTGFLSRMGVQMDENGTLSALVDEMSDQDAASTPHASWISPTPQWAIAMAIAAFAKPHIHLANPGILTDLFPAFWNLYNGLPKPDLTRKTTKEEVDVKPVRRRIIARGVYGEIPPDTPSDYDY